VTDSARDVKTSRKSGKRVVIRSIEGKVRVLSGVDAPASKEYQKALEHFAEQASDVAEPQPA
jgi:hypothetical protein